MQLRDYVINNNTLAILPYGENGSLAYENDKVVVVSKKPNKIININCIRYGSSLKGRLTCTEQLTGNTYKAPIMIIDKDNIIFFPTTSPRLKECAWINLNNIEKFYQCSDENKITIKFNNQTCVNFDISLNVLQNQIYKASRLEYIIRKNKAYLG